MTTAQARRLNEAISKYGNGMGLTFINIGQITMRLYEIAYLPKAFVEYDYLMAL